LTRGERVGSLPVLIRKGVDGLARRCVAAATHAVRGFGTPRPVLDRSPVGFDDTFHLTPGGLGFGLEAGKGQATISNVAQLTHTLSIARVPSPSNGRLFLASSSAGRLSDLIESRLGPSKDENGIHCWRKFDQLRLKFIIIPQKIYRSFCEFTIKTTAILNSVRA
jgi:hypothetical protein